MTIRFACDSCGRILKVSDSHAGKAAKCPSCKESVSIPTPSVVVVDQTNTEDLPRDEWTQDEENDTVNSDVSHDAPRLLDEGFADGFDDIGDDLSYDSPALPPRRKKSKKKKKSPTVDSEESPYAVSDYREPVPRVSRGQEKNEPTWGYAFMLLCLCIMIATRGGAIWGAVGGGVGGLCLKISQETQMPLAARVVICTLITGTLWAGIIGLVMSVT